MLCLMTLADIGAVSPEHADAVEGRPAVAPLRRRLQPAHARLRRRADRRRIRRGLSVARGRPSRRHLRGRAPRFLEGLPRRYLSLLRPGDDLPPRPPGARHPPGRSARFLEQARRRLGADGRHARQAVPVLEHLRRAVLLRHGHPSRPGDDDAGRPGARRLPVRRRGGVPAAERRRRRARSARMLEDVVAGRVDVPRCCAASERSVLYRRRRAGAAGRPLRQRALAASTPCSRSWPTTRRGCCTASAA